MEAWKGSVAGRAHRFVGQHSNDCYSTATLPLPLPLPLVADNSDSGLAKHSALAKPVRWNERDSGAHAQKETARTD